jgi:DNA-binding MarR family transcriptional regulator
LIIKILICMLRRPEIPADGHRLSALLEAVRELYGAMDRFDGHAAQVLGVDRTAVRAINLMEQGPVSPGHVGQQLGLSSGAVTALLQRLQQAGHIVRVDTEDGRRRDAQLTGNGRRAAHREFERLGRSIATQFAGEPAAQLLGLTVAMRQLTEAFDRAALGEP